MLRPALVDSDCLILVVENRIVDFKVVGLEEIRRKREQIIMWSTIDADVSAVNYFW